MFDYSDKPKPMAEVAFPTRLGEMRAFCGFEEKNGKTKLEAWFSWVDVPDRPGLKIRPTIKLFDEPAVLSTAIQVQQEAESIRQPYVMGHVYADTREVSILASGNGRGSGGRQAWTKDMLSAVDALIGDDPEFAKRAQDALERVQPLAWKAYSESLAGRAEAAAEKSDAPSPFQKTELTPEIVEAMDRKDALGVFGKNHVRAALIPGVKGFTLVEIVDMGRKKGRHFHDIEIDPTVVRDSLGGETAEQLNEVIKYRPKDSFMGDFHLDQRGVVVAAEVRAITEEELSAAISIRVDNAVGILDHKNIRPIMSSDELMRITRGWGEDDEETAGVSPKV